MKILLMGDASNYHATLARGLAERGHTVTVASDGGRWIQTHRDYDTGRRPNPVSGAILYARLSYDLEHSLGGYDIVQFSSPGFVTLRPQRLERLLRRIKARNGALYLTALGTDTPLVRNLTGASPALPYSEWQVDGHLTTYALSPAARRQQWLAENLSRYTDIFYDSLDGVMSVLYEYHRIVEAHHPHLPLTYVDIPIDTDKLPAPHLHPSDADRPVRIYFAAHRGREAEKGADILLQYLRRLKAELPDRVELLTPPNLPFAQFVEALSHADIVCDQLYSLTPATTALIGMAMGVVPISGGDEQYYSFIGHKGTRPIINIDPRNTDEGYRTLRALVEDPSALRAMSAAGPGFVATHNALPLVVSRFEEAWGI